MPLPLIFPDQYGTGLEPAVQLGPGLLAARQAIEELDRFATKTAESLLLDAVRDHPPHDVLGQPKRRRTAEYQAPACAERGDAERPNAVDLGLNRGRVHRRLAHG